MNRGRNFVSRLTPLDPLASVERETTLGENCLSGRAGTTFLTVTGAGAGAPDTPTYGAKICIYVYRCRYISLSIDKKGTPNRGTTEGQPMRPYPSTCFRTYITFIH